MKDMNIQSWVIDKLKDAEIEVISDKEEFKRILENEKLLHKMEIIENANKQDMIEEPKLSTEIINNNDDARNIALTTNDKQLLTKALSETAIPLVETVYSRENYMRIFRDGIIESPVETIKMEINQK